MGNSGIISEEDLSVFEYTGKHRKNLIDLLTEDNYPTDPKNINALIKSLDSYDKSIATKAHIKSREQDVKSHTMLAQMAAEAIKQQKMARALNNHKVNKNREQIDLSEDFIPSDIKPGETDQGTINIDYEEFNKKYNNREDVE